MRYLLPASFLLALAIACRCARLAARAPLLPAPQETVVVPALDLPASWEETDDAHATRVLLTRLTIPHVFVDKPNEICLGQFPDGDNPGMGVICRFSMDVLERAHGFDGKVGFGYVGGFSVNDDDRFDDTLILEIHYAWTARDQVRGMLDQKVSVKVDRPADFIFPDGSQLHVAWRAVSPRGTAQPGE